MCVFGQCLPAQQEFVKMNPSVDYYCFFNYLHLLHWWKVWNKKTLQLGWFADIGHNKQHKVHLHDLSAIPGTRLFYLQCHIKNHRVYTQNKNWFFEKGKIPFIGNWRSVITGKKNQERYLNTSKKCSNGMIILRLARTWVHLHQSFRSEELYVINTNVFVMKLAKNFRRGWRFSGLEQNQYISTNQKLE